MKKPDFKRRGWHKIKRIGTKWRKPKGRDNKFRRRVRGFLVQAGYGSPKKTRGMHPSGFAEKIVNNVRDLEGIDIKKEVARIRGNVGKRKRLDIMKDAKKRGVRILNPGKRALKSLKEMTISKKKEIKKTKSVEKNG